jgi:hypothetical protein
MIKHVLVLLIVSILASCTPAPKIQGVSSIDQGVTKREGAKSIFSSDDGVALSVADSSRPATNAKPPVPIRPPTSGHNSSSVASYPARNPSPVASYQGLSYWIERINRNGSAQHVTTSTTFNSGDRIRLHLKSKHPGYLYIVNQDSTGKTVLLFPNSTVGSEYIEAGLDYVIPSARAIRFDDQAGQELLWIFLTQRPLPSGDMGSRKYPPHLPTDDMGSRKYPLHQEIEGPVLTNPVALRVGYNPCGGKGMMLEEPAALGKKCGSKGLQLEEDASGSAPAEYAVAPVSDAEPGTILSLRLTLRHE